MKTLIIATILAVLTTVGMTVRGQDLSEEYLGLPGDNLNLYAVMDLFQESKTLEEFETKLNAKDSRINNLDLNGDNYVDYITVTDFVDGKIHTVVLRAVLGKDEYQDVGVFIVERLRKGKLRIQLIGDEALYGKNYIIEPRSETPNPGYSDDVYYGESVTVINNIYYYDLSWPIFDWMFMPDYVAWHSGWYWGYWPAYWDPWSPWYWHQYYGYHSNWYPHYREYYRYWNHPAHRHYNDYYYNNIRYHSSQVERRKTEGQYKETYSRPETRRDGEVLYESVRDSRRSTESVTRDQSQVTDKDSRRSPGTTVERTRVSTGETGSERTRTSTGETGSERTRTSTGETGSERTRVSTGEAGGERTRVSTGEAGGERTRVSTGQKAEENRRSTSEAPVSEEARPAVSDAGKESRRQELSTLEDEVSYEAPVRSTTRSTQVERSTTSAPERSTYEAPARSSEVQRSAPASSGSSYSAPERSTTSAPSRSTYEAPARSTSSEVQRSAPASSGSSYSAPERSTTSAPARSSSTSTPERSTSSEPAKGSSETGTAPAARRR